MTMTNKEFGACIGRTTSYVSYLRRGLRKPSFDLFAKIIDTFDLESGPAIRALESGPVSFGEYLNENVFKVLEIKTDDDGTTHIHRITSVDTPV